MSLIIISFYFFIVTAAISAVGILLVKNVFKAALYLLVCLLSLAAIYVLAFAEFVAIVQILVYAGGVLVVIIFGIMLTSKISGKPLQVEHANIFTGALVSVLLLVVLINLISKYFVIPSVAPLATAGSIQIIGMNFMTRFSLPFEITGILLLISLVGAAVITSFMKSKKI